MVRVWMDINPRDIMLKTTCDDLADINNSAM